MHQSPITAPGPADRIATSRRALGRTLLFLLLLGVAFAAGRATRRSFLENPVEADGAFSAMHLFVPLVALPMAQWLLLR